MSAGIALALPRFAFLSLATIVLGCSAPVRAEQPFAQSVANKARCAHDDGSSGNMHESRDGQTYSWRARWAGADCSIDIRSTGKVKFNSDFTDVISISNSGSLVVIDV